MVLYTDLMNLEKAFEGTKGKVELVLVDESNNLNHFISVAGTYISRIAAVRKITLSCDIAFAGAMIASLIWGDKQKNEVAYLFDESLMAFIDEALVNTFHDISVKNNKIKTTSKMVCKTDVPNTKETVNEADNEDIRKQIEALLLDTSKSSKEIAAIVGVKTTTVAGVKRSITRRKQREEKEQCKLNDSEILLLASYQKSDEEIAKTNNEIGFREIQGSIRTYEDEIKKGDVYNYVVDEFLNEQIRDICIKHNLHLPELEIFKIEKILYYYRIYEVYPGVDVYGEENSKRDFVFFEEYFKKNNIALGVNTIKLLHNLMLYYKQTYCRTITNYKYVD